MAIEHKSAISVELGYAYDPTTQEYWKAPGCGTTPSVREAWDGWQKIGLLNGLVFIPREAVQAKSPLRGYTSAERKDVPIHAFMTGYFPDALWSLARLSKRANDKHNPGEVMHWARGKSTDQLECATRHLFTPFETDPETGEIELAAVAWRALAELQLREEKRLQAAGIKPLSGVTS